MLVADPRLLVDVDGVDDGCCFGTNSDDAGVAAAVDVGFVVLVRVSAIAPDRFDHRNCLLRLKANQ